MCGKTHSTYVLTVLGALWHDGPQTLNVCIGFGPAILRLKGFLSNYMLFIKDVDKILVDFLNKRRF